MSLAPRLATTSRLAAACATLLAFGPACGPRPADTDPSEDPGPATSPPGARGGCDLAIGETYYVAPDGDDAAAGTEEAPFATIAHALDQVQPGDSVQLRAGTYHELVDIPTSGEPGAPITLTSYCGERAVLDGAGLGSGHGEPGLIRIEDQSHLRVGGFELTGLSGTQGNFPAAIWVVGECTDVAISDNIIHDIHAEDGGDTGSAHGIAVYGTSVVPAEQILIEANELYDLTLGSSEALVVNGNVRDFVIRDNLVRDADNIAFDFIGFEPDICAGCAAADLIDVDDVNRARDGLVVGNTAHHISSAGNPAYGDDKAAGCFYIDGGARIVVERNIAHHCDLGVELASEWHGKSTREITVRNNFIYANDVVGIATGGYDPGTSAGGGSAIDCLVVNNTVYDSSRDGWAEAAVLLQNRNIGNVYANNIIVATSGHATIKLAGEQNNGITVDHNLYFGGDLDGVTDDGHSVTGDPLLVDPDSGDLHLGAGSPAIDAGEDLGAEAVGAVDIDGDPRQSGVIDLGADEREDP